MGTFPVTVGQTLFVSEEGALSVGGPAGLFVIGEFSEKAYKHPDFDTVEVVYYGEETYTRDPTGYWMQ